MSFPSDRYARAGATADQLAELEAAFDALTPAGQQSVLDKIAPMSSYQLAESLQDPEPEVEETPAPVVTAPTAPVAPSGSSTSSGTTADASTTGK